MQSYNNIEYIIIDGNSKDKTKEILSQYKDNIDIFISEDDNGIYDAINKGLNLCTGDIIGLLHSDDKLHDMNVIKRIVDSLTLDIDCVYADSYFINPNNNKKTRHYSSSNFHNWQFRMGLMPSHPTIYFKSNIIKSKPLYDVQFKIASDFDLILRHFMLYKIKSKYVKDVWVIMREGGISTMGIKSKIKITNEIQLSCKKNNIYTNKIVLNLRYFYKLLGYFR
jgi:glycosyltransferase involved in cell wall biosynthesis